MKFKKLMIALQALFVIAGNLQTLPENSANPVNTSNTMILDVFLFLPSDSPSALMSMEAPTQGVQPSAKLRGKRFDWLDEMDNQANSEQGNSDKNILRLTLVYN